VVRRSGAQWGAGKGKCKGETLQSVSSDVSASLWVSWSVRGQEVYHSIISIR
jgi:hypothetical protein